VRVAEHTTTIDHAPVFYRSAGQSDSSGERPVLYVHDALTSSDDLVAFLERTGGLAPDLIGFGRSGKGGHLDYSPEGLVDFLDAFLLHLAVDRVSLVGHGWGGALGLLLAIRRPGLIERIVVINAVPLLDGFAWHRPARIWRRPVIGELAMGSTSRRLLSHQLRRGSTVPTAWSESRLATVWDQFDQGTQRALLRLHRAADETRLAELGGDLASLTIPALVLWGVSDPWFAPRFADAYAARLPDAKVEHIDGAGHWPWLDEPRLIDRVAEFLAPP
jgi:pimeloyl-ACP methyl ester carboxylesterase